MLSPIVFFVAISHPYLLSVTYFLVRMSISSMNTGLDDIYVKGFYPLGSLKLTG
jgi:hypothetical protein